MVPPALQEAIAHVPAGAWAVGVSGGADSVALLRLAAGRSDLRLVAAHLNHETRGDESDRDEAFVVALCERLGVMCMVGRRSAVEGELNHRPTNRSALYRACRRQFFQSVIERQGLQGVLLAHHADDQAETVLHRLLRGSGWSNLMGMAEAVRLGGVLVCRPLLAVGREALRSYLLAIDQPWREDASNASSAYARNRHRRLLGKHAQMSALMLDVARSVGAVRKWAAEWLPRWEESVPLDELRRWPEVMRVEALKRWLVQAGVPAEALERSVMERLMAMATDAAAPVRQHFPGNVLVRRRRGRLERA